MGFVLRFVSRALLLINVAGASVACRVVGSGARSHRREAGRRPRQPARVAAPGEPPLRHAPAARQQASAAPESKWTHRADRCLRRPFESRVRLQAEGYTRAFCRWRAGSSRRSCRRVRPTLPCMLHVQFASGVPPSSQSPTTSQWSRTLVRPSRELRLCRVEHTIYVLVLGHAGYCEKLERLLAKLLIPWPLQRLLQTNRF